MKHIQEWIDSIPLLKGQEWAIEPLNGWTNRTALLKNKQHAYVLRIPTQSGDGHINRAAEYMAIQQIASLGITPGTLFFDTQTGVQLRHYIAGEVLADHFLSPDLLERVADVLRTLHDANLEFEPISMFDTMGRDIKALQEQGVVLDSRYEILWAHCAAMQASLMSVVFVPCHMDPNLYNVIVGERLWLLDFEYAHQYDPAWDLAYLITSGNMSLDQEWVLLKCYGADPEMNTRIQAYKPMTQLSQAVWVQQQLALEDGPVDKEILIAWEQQALQSAMVYIS